MINCLKNIHIITEDKIIKGSLEIEKGVITNISTKFNEGVNFGEEMYVIPGFIDEHIHGANGSDTMDATLDDLENIACALAKEGTTSFLATTMTQDIDLISNALENVKIYMKNRNDKGAKVLGVHLEGPFINQEACGGQPKKYIIDANIELFKNLQKISGNNIKFVTLAPEIPHGLDLIKYCKENGVIASIGHTKADYKMTIDAIKSGATTVTHCFNAMTGIHHREVGVVGATFLHQELDAELIADGTHVCPEAINLLYKNKGNEKIILVTDSMRAKGLVDGVYDLGKQQVYVKNNKATLENGTLAGSVLPMIDAVKNMIRFSNLSLIDVVKLASMNPAKKLKIFNKKGSIAIGKDADLVVLDKNLDIIMTIREGRIVYQKGVNDYGSKSI